MERQRRELQERKRQLEFLLAGKAVFTIENTETGNRFTYKVKKKDNVDHWENLYFVSVLTGPDNSSDYTYIGTIFGGKEFRETKKSAASASAPSFKVFKWLWSVLGNGGGGLPEKVKFWHEGRCCRCGRTLTVPESIERGVGPECASRL